MLLQKCMMMISNLIFWAMTASVTPQSRMVHLFMGLVCLAGIWNCDVWEFYKKTNRGAKLIGGIMAVYLAYASLKHFYGVEKSMFGQDLAVGWLLLAGMAAVMAMPFLIAVGTEACQCVMLLWKRVWASGFWSIFWHGIKGKQIVLGGINLAVAAGGALLFMTLAYMIPTDGIEAHVRESAEAIKGESTYPSISSVCTSRLDNWTDAIMLGEAADAGEGPALHRALLAGRGKMEGRNPYESLIDHYTKGIAYDTYIQYPRYWHGYHVILKPLLTVMTYPQIRILNGIVEGLLFLVMCLLLERKNFGRYLVPWTLGYLMMMPIALAKSLQFAPCYYIYTIGSILLLLLPEQKRAKYMGFLFLNLGIATAFFDFLTYPVLSFCIPAALSVALDSKGETGTSLADLLRGGISWCLGYLGMWSSKWILGTLITGTNVLANAGEAIIERSSHVAKNGTETFSVFECLLKNMDAFLCTPILLLVVLWIIISIRRYKSAAPLQDEVKLKVLLPYILIGLLPVAWYLVTVNHSSIHYWFTNKALLAMFLPSLFGFVQLQTMRGKGGKTCSVAPLPKANSNGRCSELGW